MNIDLEELRNIEPKALVKKIGTFFTENRVVTSMILILVACSLVFLRISTLIRPEIDQDYFESQQQTQEEIEFGESAIEKLKVLNDSRIKVESDFTNRDNPFSDPN